MGRRDPADMHWYELPNNGGQVSIAGYNFIGGSWKDVENGAWPLERHGMDRLGDLDRVTVHYVHPDTGNDQYRTIHGPFADDLDEFLEMVEYDLDPYSD